MKGSWISPIMPTPESIPSTTLDNINGMVHEPHKSNAHAMWRTNQRNNSVIDTRQKNNSRITTQSNNSATSELTSTEQLAITKDIINDPSFKYALENKIGFKVPEPYSTVNDYLDSISLYSTTETVGAFIKDLGTLHSELSSSELMSLYEKSETAKESVDFAYGEDLQIEINQIERQAIDKFKKLHPESSNPKKLIETDHTKSNQDFLKVAVVASAALYGVRDAILPSQASYLGLPPSDDLFNSLPTELSVLSQVISKTTEFVSKSIPTLASTTTSATTTPDIWAPLAAIAGLVLGEGILGNLSKKNYDLLQTNFLKFDQQNLNNALNFVKNSLKNPVVLAGTGYATGGLYPVVALTLINTIEHRNNKDMQNRLSIPKSHLSYNACINQHHKDAITALDENVDTKKSTSINPEKRTVLLRMLNHQFSTLTDQKQIQNLEDKVETLSDKKEQGFNVDIELDTAKEELKKHQNNLDSNFKTEVLMSHDDLKLIKSFKNGRDFDNPLKTLINIFNKTKGDSSTTTLTIGQLTAIQATKYLNEAQDSQISSTSPLKETVSTSTIDGKEDVNRLARLLELISDPMFYNHPRSILAAVKYTDEANKILSSAQNNSGWTTSIEEQNLLRYINPTAILEENLKTALSEEYIYRMPAGDAIIKPKGYNSPEIIKQQRIQKQRKEVRMYMDMLKTTYPSANQVAFSDRWLNLKVRSKKIITDTNTLASNTSTKVVDSIKETIENPMDVIHEKINILKDLSEKLKGLDIPTIKSSLTHYSIQAKDFLDKANNATKEKANGYVERAKSSARYNTEKILLTEDYRMKKDISNKDDNRSETLPDSIIENWGNISGNSWRVIASHSDTAKENLISALVLSKGNLDSSLAATKISLEHSMNTISESTLATKNKIIESLAPTKNSIESSIKVISSSSKDAQKTLLASFEATKDYLMSLYTKGSAKGKATHCATCAKSPCQCPPRHRNGDISTHSSIFSFP